MKKIFTLIAVALVAIGAQAQSEKVLFTNGETYNNGATLTSEHTKVVLGNDRTTKPYDVKLASCKDYCAELFGQTVQVKNDDTGEMEDKVRVVYVVGNQNPKDGELDKDTSTGGGYKTDKGNLPQSGTYYMITPDVDGHICAYIVLNSGKNFYVVKASDGLPLDYTALTIKADLEDGPTVVELAEDYTTSEKVNGTVEFDVVAGETYYVFCTGSKLSFGGYVFTPGEGGGPQQDALPEGEKEAVGTSGWSVWQSGTETVTANEDGTMTYVSGAWGGMAKWLGGRDLSKYDYLVFEFTEPAATKTQIMVQFAEADEAGDDALKVAAEAGATYIFVKLDDPRINNVNQIALQTEEATTLQIKDVYYIKKPGGDIPVGPEGEKESIMDKFTYTWNGAETIERADDGTITFTSASWGGLAAWLADNDIPADWSGYTKLVFEYAEPTTVNTQILVSNGDTNVASAWGNPGITSLECPFDGKDVSAVKQVALQTSDPTVLKVSAIYLVKKADIEGISEAQVLTVADGAAYNLAGMRVGKDYKGIVIKNGRKFIQK